MHLGYFYWCPEIKVDTLLPTNYYAANLQMFNHCKYSRTQLKIFIIDVDLGF